MYEMIYLDYAATTPVAEDVAASFHAVQGQFFGNPTSLHTVGLEAAKLMADAKAQMATLLGVQSDELITTSGATEANNLALFGAARAYKGRGHHIITTSIEHASVREPLKALEQEGYDVTYLPVDSEGRVSKAAVLAALRDTTVLVSIMHINNELGSIQPIEEIAAAIKAKAPQVVVHSDMAQSIGKIPIQLSNIDLATFSSHKFYGPKSIGLLYKKRQILLEPLFYGGSQQDSLRPGTENPALVVAAAKAMRLSFERLMNDEMQAEIIAKRNYLVQQILLPEADVRVSIAHHDFTRISPYIVHFSIVNSETQIATYLNAFTQRNIYLSTRSTCHSSVVNDGNPLLEAVGYSRAESRRGLRLSLSHLTTMSDITTFGVALKEVIEALKV